MLLDERRDQRSSPGCSGRHGFRSFQLTRPAEVLLGFIVLFSLLEQDAPVPEAFGHPRITPDRLVHGLERLVRFPDLPQSETPREMRLGIIRFQADDRVEVGQRVLEFPLPEPGFRPIPVRLCILGVEADGFVVVGDRFVDLPPVLSKAASAHESPGEMGIETDRFIVVRECIVRFRKVVPRESPPVERRGIGRLELDGFVEVTDRLLMVFAADTVESAIDVGLHGVRSGLARRCLGRTGGFVVRSHAVRRVSWSVGSSSRAVPVGVRNAHRNLPASRDILRGRTACRRKVLVEQAVLTTLASALDHLTAHR